MFADADRRLVEVRLSDWALDPEINRATDDAWVQKIATGFNALALGLFTGWQQNGRVITLDGQHRKLAAEQVDYDDPVAAYVYTGLTERTAAELFLQINAQRNVNPIDKFRKAVQAGHELEVAVASMLAAYSLQVGRSAGDVGSPSNLLVAYKRLGDQRTRAMIELLLEAFAGTKAADMFSGEMLWAVSNVIFQHERRKQEVDLELLRTALEDLTYTGLMALRTRLHQSGGGGTERWHLANAITRAYNEAAPRGRKVRPWAEIA